MSARKRAGQITPWNNEKQPEYAVKDRGVVKVWAGEGALFVKGEEAREVVREQKLGLEVLTRFRKVKGKKALFAWGLEKEGREPPTPEAKEMRPFSSLQDRKGEERKLGRTEPMQPR